MTSNYKSLHLQWIRSHPAFVAKFSHLQDQDLSHLDIMTQLYVDERVTNEIAQMFFKLDVKWFIESQKDILTFIKQQHKAEPMSPIFVTIGFNHQTWTPQSCVKVIQTILGLNWIGTMDAVFEYHRSNGLHPHVHMVIKPSVPLSKSKVLEKLWAVSGMKKVCLKKSFIDYKIATDVHANYILGEKQQSKMEYVLLDKIWRERNGIEHLYQKL